MTFDDYKTKMSVDAFIENIRNGLKNAEEEKFLENYFTRGHCYHFAVIMANLFRGHIIYNGKDNHFAFLNNDGNIYDITGKIGEYNSDWILWEQYQLDEPIESERIIEQCCYKIYVG